MPVCFLNRITHIYLGRLICKVKFPLQICIAITKFSSHYFLLCNRICITVCQEYVEIEGTFRTRKTYTSRLNQPVIFGALQELSLVLCNCCKITNIEAVLGKLWLLVQKAAALLFVYRTCTDYFFMFLWQRCTN